jgi:hypothetical protein
MFRMLPVQSVQLGEVGLEACPSECLVLWGLDAVVLGRECFRA